MKKKMKEKILQALNEMEAADNMLDYDTALFKVCDCLNKFTEEIEKDKPFLLDRRA